MRNIAMLSDAPDIRSGHQDKASHPNLNVHFGDMECVQQSDRRVAEVMRVPSLQTFLYC